MPLDPRSTPKDAMVAHWAEETTTHQAERRAVVANSTSTASLLVWWPRWREETRWARCRADEWELLGLRRVWASAATYLRRVPAGIHLLFFSSG